LIHLILSLDYEVFGSGSGDVRRDMIEPTYRLLALCGRYGAKLSIMLEVGEYWAIKKAEEAGFVADSSVVKGMYETKPVLTDYRQAQSAMGYWWTSAEDISQPGPKGEQVIEFPVCSRLRPYVCNLKWRKLHATLRMVWVARTNTHDHRLREAAGSVEPPGKILKKLFTLQPVKYDFCKFTASDMIRRLRRLIKRDQNLGDDFGTPVVMLGHSKAFWNDQNLEMFLTFIKNECEAKVCFSTFRELTKRILKRDAQFVEGLPHRVLP
jgi:hypothetical protein